jgi:hypothetical protein
LDGLKQATATNRSFDSALCAIAQDAMEGDGMKMRKPFGLRMGEF